MVSKHLSCWVFSFSVCLDVRWCLMGYVSCFRYQSPCNGNGVCSAGKTGSGNCTCNAGMLFPICCLTLGKVKTYFRLYPGFYGNACQYSDTVDCSGHGSVQMNGKC